MGLLISTSISALSNCCGQSLFFNLVLILVSVRISRSFYGTISELHYGIYFFVDQIMSATQYILYLALFRQKFSKSQF